MKRVSQKKTLSSVGVIQSGSVGTQGGVSCCKAISTYFYFFCKFFLVFVRFNFTHLFLNILVLFQIYLLFLFKFIVSVKSLKHLVFFFLNNFLLSIRDFFYASESSFNPEYFHFLNAAFLSLLLLLH